MRSHILHILFGTIGKLPPVFNELVMLSREGMHVDVLCLEEQGDGTRIESAIPGVTMHTVKIAFRSLNARQTRLAKLARYVEYAIRVFLFTVRYPAAIIVGHDLAAAVPAYVAARLRSRKFVYNAHEIWGEAGGLTAPFPALWRALDHLLCPHVDALVTPEANRARVYETEYGARSSPYVVRNFPMYRPRTESDTLRRFMHERGLTPDIIIMYQGIFDPGRCLVELVEAMVHVDVRASLVLLGRGSTEQIDAIRDAITGNALQQRVLLHPFVSYDRLHEVTCSADIGVLFYRDDSRNNRYCAPNKLYEYFQAGLPVVAANLPGLREIVESHGLGICVDPASGESIAKGISLLIDPDRRKMIRDIALEISKMEWHWEREFAILRHLYDNLATDSLSKD